MDPEDDLIALDMQLEIGFVDGERLSFAYPEVKSNALAIDDVEAHIRRFAREATAKVIAFMRNRDKRRDEFMPDGRMTRTENT